jgi:transcriptional regulator with XRE-family HTH domain
VSTSSADPATLRTAECQGDRRLVATMLREARERLGLTQQEVARRVGGTQSMVARWESGDHEIKLQTLGRLAEALDCDLTVHFSAAGGSR